MNESLSDPLSLHAKEGKDKKNVISSHRQISTQDCRSRNHVCTSLHVREGYCYCCWYTARGVQQHQPAAAVAHLRWKSKLGIPHMTSGLSRVKSRCVALVSLHPASAIVLRIAAAFAISSACGRSGRFRKRDQG